MPRISLPVLPASWEENGDTPERRSIWEVLGIEDIGGSPRGSSYWRTLFTCPREFAYRYILGFRSLREFEALTIGQLFHLALQIYYEEIMGHQRCAERPKAIARRYRPAWEHFWWGGSARATEKAMDTLSPVSEEPGYAATWVVVERVLSAYFDRYWKTDEWEIYAVEETLELSTAAFDYSVRLDLLAYDFVKRGLVVVEHKSARYLSVDLLDNYQQDLQILGQVYTYKNVVDQTAYPPMLGVVVNIATKQVEPKLDRVECFPSKLHIAAFEESMRSWSHLYKAFESAGWPRALGKCAGAGRGYGKCEFYELCHGHPEMGVEDWRKHGTPIGFEQREVK